MLYNRPDGHRLGRPAFPIPAPNLLTFTMPPNAPQRPPRGLPCRPSFFFFPVLRASSFFSVPSRNIGIPSSPAVYLHPPPPAPPPPPLDALPQIGRLENENKSLAKSLENAGGGSQLQQMQEMQQALLRKMDASSQHARPTSRGTQDIVSAVALSVIYCRGIHGFVVGAAFVEVW